MAKPTKTQDPYVQSTTVSFGEGLGYRFGVDAIPVSGDFGKTTATVTKSTTFDPVINFHEITDEKLRELINMNRGTSWDIALTCVGIVIGFGQNFIAAVDAVINSMPVGTWNAIGSILFILAFGVGIYSGVNWYGGKGDLREAIDELKKRPVRTESFGGYS